MQKLLFIVLLGCFLLTNSFVGPSLVQSKLLWNTATVTTQIDKYIKESTPVLFFKHSYKCGYSIMIFEDFEKEWNVPAEQCSIVFIDVWKNRDVSNYLSEITGISHHSPQVIVMSKGKKIYNETHGKIKVSEVKKVLINNKS